jgi:hypothetical protein
MKRMSKKGHIILLFILCASYLMAQENGKGVQNRVVEAIYLEDASIKTDGVLNEEIWEKGPWQSDFTQNAPRDGLPASCKTRFKVFYDDDYLYVGARAYDPNPSEIKALLSRRDEYTHSDWMYISIDSYNDNRTAFEFGINAAGVLHDIRRYDDGNADWDWDAVWDGAAYIDDEGWTAEWRIPFSELRFNASPDMEWGFHFYREAPNCNNEVSLWNYWSKSDNGFVSNFGTLRGLKNIRSDNPLYVIPYGVGRLDLSKNLETPNHPEHYDFLARFGGDIRYSSPSGLTMNATINPDFGQVEADPADYNLTTFETYFREKRTFFMEGANILQFPLGFGDGDMGHNTLFYTRRIGRTPTASPQTDDNKQVEEIQAPDETHILSAAKLTGKTSSDISIGVMDALTAEETATVYYDDGTKDHPVVEPFTNYGLIRLQKDYHDGETTVGGIITSVNRKLDGTGITSLHTSAYTGGLDINHRFADNEYTFIGHLAFSHVMGDTTAIQRTQKHPSRYFQRSDADHLTYDPTRESLSGYTVKGIFIKNRGHIRGATGLIMTSPGFEVNDLGYYRSVDDIMSFLWLQYQEWEPGAIYKQYGVNFNSWLNYDYSGMRKIFGGNVNYWGQFLNNWSHSLGINVSDYGITPYMNRGGPALRTPGKWNVWVSAKSDERKKVIWGMFGYYFKNKDNVTGYEMGQELTFRPLNNLHIGAKASLNILDDTWAWIGKVQTEGQETQYIWADLLQKTLNITFRANWTLTPKLSLQYYAQPFFTAGEYSNYKRVDNPRAKDFNKRFENINDRIAFDEEEKKFTLDMDADGTPEYTFGGQTDFNYKQFRSNFVLRWEYSSGSTFYLVWSQGFNDYRSLGNFEFTRDVQDLFRAPGDNVIMIKMSHMFKVHKWR